MTEIFSDHLIEQWKQEPAILRGLAAVERLKVEKASYHSENYIRLMLSVAGDIRVILLKMEELLDEVRRLSNLTRQRQKEVAGTAYYLFAPIAHRLGFYKVKKEFEDRAMQVLFPEAWYGITRKLQETEKERNAYLSRIIDPIREILTDNGFTPEIKGRSKSIHSIWMKMKNQKVSFEEVYDLLALRIIFDSIPEEERSGCWKIYSLVTSMYTPNPARLRDWVTSPKSSGYEALHTTVRGPQNKWIEVQIRSRRMDENAERGDASHWKYKAGGQQQEADNWLAGLREKIETPDKQALEEELAEGITFTDPHIFVFTPQGDLLRLPSGSTVLDFAFTVHSSIGEKCTGARVNGKMVPIRYILNNGDTVEIQTSKNQKPSIDWLQCVASARTRSKIRKILRDEELKEAEAGKEMLFRKLRNWKVTFTEAAIDELVRKLRYPTHLDFYHAIATGKEDPKKVKQLLTAPPTMDPAMATATPETIAKKEEKSEDVIYLDQHLVNVNYTLARCCSPVFGDPVFGFITISRGVTIHRVSCPNAMELQRRYKYRVARVLWRKPATEQSFQATLRIQGVDEVGVLNQLSDLVSNKLGMNIRSISMDTKNGIFNGKLTVLVKDNHQLEMLIHQLMKFRGILKVARIKSG